MMRMELPSCFLATVRVTARTPSKRLRDTSSSKVSETSATSDTRTWPPPGVARTITFPRSAMRGASPVVRTRKSLFPVSMSPPVALRCLARTAADTSPRVRP